MALFMGAGFTPPRINTNADTPAPQMSCAPNLACRLQVLAIKPAKLDLLNGF